MIQRKGVVHRRDSSRFRVAVCIVGAAALVASVFAFVWAPFSVSEDWDAVPQRTPPYSATREPPRTSAPSEDQHPPIKPKRFEVEAETSAEDERRPPPPTGQCHFTPAGLEAEHGLQFVPTATPRLNWRLEWANDTVPEAIVHSVFDPLPASRAVGSYQVLACSTEEG
eukprot:Hpha_TRINITY_DN16889_c5_g3::TRINITY_DN16889_c5_g3_i3::g.148337::m.148337